MRTQPTRLVQDISKQVNKSATYHGFLAENYDGIGQYVLVTMSKSSSSAALRARIASGDFATRQSMPVGTPVIVFVRRGQAEILTMGAK